MRVVIIGAGLMGVTTAHFLRQHGAEVTVLERQSGPGLETSYGNGALLHPSFAAPWNEPGVVRELIRWLGRKDAPIILRLRALPSLLFWGVRFLHDSTVARHRRNTLKNFQLARYSVEMMADIRESTAIEYGQNNSGTLELFRDRAGFDAASRSSKILSDQGLIIDTVGPNEILQYEPAIGTAARSFIGGMYFHGDELGDPYRFCAEMTRIGRNMGIDYQYDVTVDGIEMSGRRVCHVRAQEQVFEADIFVMSAGCYSEPLLRPIGLQIPVRPAKGYSATVRHSSTVAPKLPVVDHDTHLAVIPVGDDQVRAVGIAEFAGFDLSIDSAQIDYLKASVTTLVPEFAAEVASIPYEPWTGLRPVCPDGVPLIGPTGLENLYLNTGHGHLGWTLAAGSGKLAADLIAGATPDITAADFTPGRFPRLAGP